MCMLVSCFGLALDAVQRFITFILACWISCAVVCVLLVAAVAGCAYGYNYSMAEFLTFTRSDVTVYMRRGQFYDRPDVVQKDSFRSYRKMGDEDDAFPDTRSDGNEVADYEARPLPAETKPLVDSWVNAQNSQLYAEKLTKYNPVFNMGHRRNQDSKTVQDTMPVGRPISVLGLDDTRRRPNERVPVAHVVEKIVTANPKDTYYKMTNSHSHVPKLISITPNIMVSTDVWQSGSSKIIMRNFHVTTIKDAPEVFDDEAEYESRAPGARFRNLVPPKTQYLDGVKETNAPVVDFGPEEVTKSLPAKPVRHWGPTPTPLFQDYTEEVDEDNIIYKPG